MKRLLFLPLCLLIGGTISIGMSGCGDQSKKTDTQKGDSTQMDSVAVKDTAVAEKFPPLPINYDQTKVLKNLYVVDRAGVVLRQGADESAPALGKYPYGTKLDVIGEEGGWIAVMDRIQRDYKGANGEAIDVTQWEKVYVEKSKLGKQDKITISPKDLNIIVSQTVNGKESYYEKGHPLDKYLFVELIDEQAFLAARNTAKNYLIKDTLSYSKNGDVLELPLTNGKTLTFTDKDIDNESEARYSYMGHYDFLNAFAVAGNYWESADVRLFDRKDGHLIVECGDYPFFSVDKKYLMTLHADPYESTGDLQLFHVKQGKVSPLISVSFKEWMPSWKEELLFWGKDGHIYAAANHVNGYWGEDGSLSERSQFIRIKLLEP
ncbi:SH3 domain-containing protein [Sphingobacterium sp. NGMCC 1.201703]|uniref:SH3 domain-containing protein n=1 Tax=Sphingobacterium sp. NGMCC 1.201703 TaxID=3388657 RepID=UPI0039FC1F64